MLPIGSTCTSAKGLRPPQQRKEDATDDDVVRCNQFFRTKWWHQRRPRPRHASRVNIHADCKHSPRSKLDAMTCVFGRSCKARTRSMRQADTLKKANGWKCREHEHAQIRHNICRSLRPKQPERHALYPSLPKLRRHTWLPEKNATPAARTPKNTGRPNKHRCRETGKPSSNSRVQSQIPLRNPRPEDPAVTERRAAPTGRLDHGARQSVTYIRPAYSKIVPQKTARRTPVTSPKTCTTP